MLNSKQLEILQSIYSIDIPDIFLQKVRILVREGEEFKDSGKYAYKFDEPLECPFIKGYYYVPSFTKFVINRNGDMKNVRTGRSIKWSKAGVAKTSIRGGYKVTLVKSDLGIRRGISRHRALVLTFKSYDRHPDEFLVNHKDGVGGNDWLDNLEVVTASENVQHAYDIGLYSNKVRPVDAHNWITNTYHSFDRVQKCVDTLVVECPILTYELVYGRLRSGNNRRHEDGWRFKYKEDSWLSLDKNVNQNKNEREVVCRNVHECVVYIFRSIGEAARQLNQNNGTIRDQCVNKVLVPVNGWQFRFVDDFTGWPKYSEQQIQIFKEYPYRPGDGVEVYDLNTNQTQFFTSPQNAAEYFGISPITVAKLARYEGTRARRYKFKLVRIRENY